MIRATSPRRVLVFERWRLSGQALALAGTLCFMAVLGRSASAQVIEEEPFSPILWSKQNTLGSLAFERENYREAQDRFEQALLMARRSDARDEFLPISLNNLAETLSRLGYRQRAENLLLEALSASRAGGEQREHAITIVLINLAAALCSSGDCGEAADYIAEARVLREKALAEARQRGEEPWSDTSAPLYLLSISRQYMVVPVYYATDRAIGDPTEPAEFYNNDRGDLQLGVADVSVPLGHRMGNLTAPTWWKLEFDYDPASHVTLLETRPRPEDDFFAQMRQRVEESPKKLAFVFIHGFHTSFARVTRRAAQLSYDLGFDGAPIVYCWPSQGELTEEAYIIDRQNAEWTTDHLADFLGRLARELDEADARVCIVAHSMGSQALARALQRLATREEFKDTPPFAEVMFTAPDIDSDVFRRLMPDVMRVSDRVTVYVSANDKALNYSLGLHGGLPRAGYSGEDVFLMPGVDTIEVSAVDTSFIGHGYYGENRSVLSDVYYLVNTGAPPNQRYGLTPMISGGQRYWKFRP